MSKGRSQASNNARSNSMNPNNAAHHAAANNHANQCNPNNPTYPTNGAEPTGSGSAGTAPSGEHK